VPPPPGSLRSTSRLVYSGMAATFGASMCRSCAPVPPNEAPSFAELISCPIHSQPPACWMEKNGVPSAASTPAAATCSSSSASLAGRASTAHPGDDGQARPRRPASAPSSTCALLPASTRRAAVTFAAAHRCPSICVVHARARAAASAVGTTTRTGSSSRARRARPVPPVVLTRPRKSAAGLVLSRCVIRVLRPRDGRRGSTARRCTQFSARAGGRLDALTDRAKSLHNPQTEFTSEVPGARPACPDRGPHRAPCPLRPHQLLRDRHPAHRRRPHHIGTGSRSSTGSCITGGGCGG
jgi:hypothetical protein